jgi:hypothetical protein
MLDAFLDLAAVILPTVLSVGSVLVSIKTPHSKHHRLWYGGIILTGLGISGLTGWQQYRSRDAHSREVSALTGRLEAIEKNTKVPPTVQVTNNVPPTQVVITPPNSVTKKRTLTTAQVSAFRLALGRHQPGQIQLLLYLSGDLEAQGFRKILLGAFDGTEWQIQNSSGSGNLIAPDFFGIQVCFGPNGGDANIGLKEAFTAAGLSVEYPKSGSGCDNTSIPSSIWVEIGHQQ